MPINPSIALGVKPMELPDPLAAYSKLATIQQGQTQNQLYQMQMEKLRREQTALNMLNEAYGKSVDPTTGAVDQNMLAQNLAQMGQGAQIPGALESFAKLAEQQAKRQKAELDVATTRMSQARDALTVVTTPGQYAQWRVNTISQLPGLANMIPLDYTPDTVRRLMAGAEKWLAETAPAKPTQPLAPSITEIQDPTNPLQTLRIDARDYKGGGLGSPGVIGISVPKAPPAPRTPVAVVGPDGKPVLVSPEEAIGKTPAAAMEGLTPKEKQKREAAYPKSTSALKTTEQDIDQMVKDIQTLLTDPGLNSITGLVYGRTPSVTREGRRAQALYDKIIAKGGFQMLSNMRAASPTGGALGNVSDREGVQLRAAFAALDRTQDAADVKQVLTDLITQLGATKTNLREAYDLTYEYRTGGGAAPTSGGWSIVK